MTILRRRLRELVLWAGAALGLLAITAGVLVAFLGFDLLVFRSGSMSPDIPTGGIALSRSVAAADVVAGDVVSVIAGNGERITHRVVSSTLRGDEASLVLKGDANATADSELYVVSSVDRVVASAPFGGYVIVHALTPPGILAVASLSAMLLLLSGGGEVRPQPRRRGTPRRRRAGTPPLQGLLAAGTVLAVLGGGVLAVGHVSGTWASFTDRATASSGSLTSNRFFTCDAFARGAASPFLYWKLDEAAATSAVTGAADSSGNNRAGSYSLAGVTYGAARACSADTGTAVTLNGTTGAIGQPATRAAVAGPNTFSISTWFRTTTTRGGKLIGFGNARTGASTQYDRHVYMTDAGRLVFGVFPGGVQTVTSPASYNDNQWHQVVATLGSTGMRLYVDGALVGSNTAVTTGESYSGYWRVGQDNLNSWTTQPSSQFFAGTLDEVTVHLAVLSASDIAAGFGAGG